MTAPTVACRADAQRTLAIELAAQVVGDAPGMADIYVDDVAADPWTDDEFEALQ